MGLQEILSGQGGRIQSRLVAKPFENRHLLAQVPDFYERLKDSYDEKFFNKKYWDLTWL